MGLSTNLDFLSGALAATSKMEIVSIAKIPEGHYGKPIDIVDLHSHTLTWIGDEDLEVVATKKGDGQQDYLYIDGRGGVFEIRIDLSFKVETLKALIREKKGFPKNWKLKLVADKTRQRLDDGKKLSDYNIKPFSYIQYHETTPLRGGGGDVCIDVGDYDLLPIYVTDGLMFDKEYNYDFTNESDDGKMFKRGKWTYNRPYGWNRVALNVKSRFPDSAWLGGIGRGDSSDIRTCSVDGEWPVSYHGTDESAALKIAEQGFDLNKGRRFLFGRGIYSTPDPWIAEQYATDYEFKGKNYKVLLQNRVNMAKTEFISDMNYFVTENEDNIRPYGLLFKEISSSFCDIL